MSYLLAIATATPRYCHSQEDLAAFYCRTIPGDAHTQRKIRILAQKSGIAQRYSVLPDYALPVADYTFFEKNTELEPMPLLSRRMARFQPEALALSLDAVRRLPDWERLRRRISHIITVTCTGLFAPGLDIDLLEALELAPSTSRSGINFMGCNAAVLALKQAHQICRSEPGATVLIVCTELCTLHFQKSYTDDYLVSNLLFADGSAAAVVSSEATALPESFGPVEITGFRSLVIGEGRSDMAWRLSEEGFLMNLSSYVSPLLNTHLPHLLQDMGLDVDKPRHLALHPGGKRILDDFCHTLHVDRAQLRASYEVLAQYGNMSSATLLFVVLRLLETTAMQAGDTLFAAAFGPGLNIETATMRYV
ncbi:MAG: type III polyketide synthase [Bacteroidia bacterium]